SWSARRLRPSRRRALTCSEPVVGTDLAEDDRGLFRIAARDLDDGLGDRLSQLRLHLRGASREQFDSDRRHGRSCQYMIECRYNTMCGNNVRSSTPNNRSTQKGAAAIAAWPSSTSPLVMT